MSDFPNGRPPGQNNLDATTERYVDPANDPSATAPKPDADRPKEDGIEAREDAPHEVQQELNEATKNVVQPASVEDNQQQQSQQETQSLPGPDTATVTEEQDTTRKAEAGQSADRPKAKAR